MLYTTRKGYRLLHSLAAIECHWSECAMEKGSRITSRKKSSARVFPQSVDMNKRKKVKFLDPISSREPSGRQDLPSFRTERVLSPSAGDAKTSEFKSFKRLLGESDRKRRFNQIPKHDNNLKTFEGGECVREKNGSVTGVSDAKRSLFPVQNVTPIAQMSSPSVRILQNFELDKDSKYKHNTSSLLSPIQKVTSDCWRSSFSPENISLNCGPEHEYDGTFLKKRKKLLQLVAEASSHKVEELLSNKSDLILVLLQRLGSGRKSGNLDELPKPGQKVMSDGYHSPALLKSCGDNKELQGTVKADFQHTLRRKWEMGLLTTRCCDSDELIAFPVNHVQDQTFPTYHALESGFDCRKWQSILVSDEKGKSNLYDENKLASTSDRGWYQTADHILSKGDELMALPLDYPTVQTFPTSNALDSGLQGIQWHSDPISDDGIFENKSARRGYCAMDTGRMLPKVDEFVSLPHDHAELQAFPAWEFPDASLQGRRWCSNSVFKEEGISENSSISAEFHMMDRLLSKDDELVILPSDVQSQSLSARHAIQTGLQGRNKHSISVLGGISDVHPENGSTSPGAYSKYQFHSAENMLSKFSYWMPNNFPSRGQSKDQLIVPYINYASSYDLGGRDLYSELAKEQRTLPLLQWSGSSEPELSCPTAGEHSKRLDCLPLTLYSAPDLLDRTDGLRAINVSGRRNTFSSLTSSYPLSTSIPGVELELNSLPIDFGSKHCWPTYTKLPFEREQVDGGLSCIATRNRYDGCEMEQNLRGIQGHFPADFLTLGLKFSVDREKSIFGSLPERLSREWL